jgi:agmatine deiminase
LLWPDLAATWPHGAEPAREAFVAVATTIAAFEPVTVGVSARHLDDARRRLPAAVRVRELTANDSWMRDTGPMVLVDDAGGRLGVQWDWNAYGGLYAPFDDDKWIARKVLAYEGISPVVLQPLVLEGGAVQTDGQGTLLTTEECLLNPDRNPGLSRAEIETALLAGTQAAKVIWLGPGTYGDKDTSGHVDNLAFFVEPGVIALAWEEDPADPQHAISQDALVRLSRATDARGRSFEVVKVPMPLPVTVTAADLSPGIDHRQAGQRLAASYINCYLPNGGLVFPAYGGSQDDVAAALFTRLYPKRRIASVPARDILLGGGSIHCITHEIPAG